MINIKFYQKITQVKLYTSNSKKKKAYSFHITLKVLIKVIFTKMTIQFKILKIKNLIKIQFIKNLSNSKSLGNLTKILYTFEDFVHTIKKLLINYTKKSD